MALSPALGAVEDLKAKEEEDYIHNLKYNAKRGKFFPYLDVSISTHALTN